MNYNQKINTLIQGRSNFNLVAPKPVSKHPKLYDYLYSDLTYGSEVKDNIIGVCVIGRGILPDGKARFMSVKPMSLTTPDVGGDSEEHIYWGGNVDTSLTNYKEVVIKGDSDVPHPFGFLPKNGTYTQTDNNIPNPITEFDEYSSTLVVNSLSDFDGKGNTEVLTDLATAQSDWKTAAITNNNGSGYYPAACTCWRFNPGNTNQGDWYLPAMGELGFVIVNFDGINTKINAISGVQLDGNNNYWSSTEKDEYDTWALHTESGTVGPLDRIGRNYVRAFLAL